MVSNFTQILVKLWGEMIFIRLYFYELKKILPIISPTSTNPMSLRKEVLMILNHSTFTKHIINVNFQGPLKIVTTKTKGQCSIPHKNWKLIAYISAFKNYG